MVLRLQKEKCLFECAVFLCYVIHPTITRINLQVRNEFYKDTQGAMLVYDVSDRQSFEALEHWLNEMRTEIGNQAEIDNIVFVVCANKVCGELFNNILSANMKHLGLVLSKIFYLE